MGTTTARRAWSGLDLRGGWARRELLGWRKRRCQSRSRLRLIAGGPSGRMPSLARCSSPARPRPRPRREPIRSTACRHCRRWEGVGSRVSLVDTRGGSTDRGAWCFDGGIYTGLGAGIYSEDDGSPNEPIPGSRPQVRHSLGALVLKRPRGHSLESCNAKIRAIELVEPRAKRATGRSRSQSLDGKGAGNQTPREGKVDPHRFNMP